MTSHEKIDKSVRCWMTISNAPKDGCHARDINGIEHWTWIELGDWVYEQWLKSDRGEDCLCFIPWDPVEWQEPNSEG